MPKTSRPPKHHYGARPVDGGLAYDDSDWLVRLGPDGRLATRKTKLEALLEDMGTLGSCYLHGTPDLAIEDYQLGGTPLSPFGQDVLQALAEDFVSASEAEDRLAPLLERPDAAGIGSWRQLDMLAVAWSRQIGHFMRKSLSVEGGRPSTTEEIEWADMLVGFNADLGIHTIPSDQMTDLVGHAIGSLSYVLAQAKEARYHPEALFRIRQLLAMSEHAVHALESFYAAQTETLEFGPGTSPTLTNQGVEGPISDWDRRCYMYWANHVLGKPGQQAVRFAYRNAQQPSKRFQVLAKPVRMQLESLERWHRDRSAALRRPVLSSAELPAFLLYRCGRQARPGQEEA